MTLGFTLVLTALTGGIAALVLATVALPWRAAIATLLLAAGLVALVMVAERRLPGTPRQEVAATLPDAEVLWAAGERGRRLLLLLRWDGQVEPRYVEIPWTDELARDLQDGQASAAVHHRPLRMRLRNGGRPASGPSGGPATGDQGRKDAVFYTDPPIALPPKE